MKKTSIQSRLKITPSGKKCFDSFEQFEIFITALVSAGYSFRYPGNSKLPEVNTEKSFYGVHWTYERTYKEEDECDSRKDTGKPRLYFVTQNSTVYKYYPL
jgi:hypothetical protein